MSTFIMIFGSMILACAMVYFDDSLWHNPDNENENHYDTEQKYYERNRHT